MAELSGSLAAIGITQLLEFLSVLGKTGDLLVLRGNWVARLSLDGGRLSAASVENEHGLAALEFIALCLQAGEFEYIEGLPGRTPDFDASTEPLAQLKQLTAGSSSPWLSLLPEASSIPRVVLPDALADSDLALSRSAIDVLLQLDGLHSVRDIATRRGLRSTMTSLGHLFELGLIRFDSAKPLTVVPPTLSRRSDSERWTPSLPATRTGRWRHAARDVLEWMFRSALAQAVLVTCLAVLGVRSVVQNFRIDGVSMEPSFEAGQVVVVNRAAYFHIDGAPLVDRLPTTRRGTSAFLFGGPQRGDAAVFRAPPQLKTDYLKRIIGLPGDSVLVKDGRVIVNGTALTEPYIQYPSDYTFPEDGLPLRVPDNSYFVLGDNRPESFDSHAGWLVPVEDLIGQVWVRYWPPGELGLMMTGQLEQPVGEVAERSPTLH
jgi:signal peptidase I